MTGSRKRRALLRAGATGIAGLAGCVGGFGGESDGGTSATTVDESTGTTSRPTYETPDTTSETTIEATDETTADATSEPTEETATDGTTEPTDEPPVQVTSQSVQSSFFYLTTPDQMDVAAPDGRQFAFVTVVPSADEPPSVDEFGLVADGRRFPATTIPGPITNPYYLYDQEHVYDPEDGREGWLAFEVPDPLDAENVAVTFGDHERSMGGEFLADLRAPPAEFELASFDAPERVTPDETFEISFAVRNVGEADAIFRACLNETGPSHVPHPVELSVPPGEQREWSRTFGSRLSGGTASATYRFRSSVADRDVTVEVAAETETTTDTAAIAVRW